MIPVPESKQQATSESDAPSCDSSLVHLERIRQVQSEIVTTEKAQQMAQFFGAMADPHRLKLLSALVKAELCVCDLAAVVKMSESAVSHQLRLLRNLRLVKYRREGRNVYYSLADDHVVNLYREVAEHLEEA
ncbi:MAG: metalloregulator ArsR/SmtB family transcription factor [Xenococcaceae cyanobacterium MO_207.B15]|nr:metalloregulator ArsR/SmtB family transcription factor [Xenococcaceae cyanobacterium MO_207.B15]MDJ0747439.1 metalloregulator ArsR/SmtB family transcription factor [Xenococcaceae cyanobacterium MO_167.B27]